jgi:photosystem II stability/assembly factor-like uncharacterized protein
MTVGTRDKRVDLLRIAAALLVTTLGLIGSRAAPALAQEEGQVILRYEGRWDRQESGVSDDLNDVMFVNPLVGYAVGDQSTILKTTDGGWTWTRLGERRERGSNYRSVHFINEREGWVQASDALVTTRDGGQTWQPAAPPNTPPSSAVFSYGANWNLGSTRFQVHTGTTASTQSLSRSDDLGRTWTTLNPRLPHNNFGEIVFVDPNNGFLGLHTAIGSSVAPELLFATSDGGQTLRPIAREQTGSSPAFVFLNSMTGWASGRDGATMLATTDGGNTWERQGTGMGSVARHTDLQFFDAALGHLLSNYTDNTVLRTSDGGWTWTVLGTSAQMGLAGAANALWFTDSDHGWVVSNRGSIAHYHVVPVWGYPEE